MTETSKPLPASGLLNEVNDEFSGLTLALSKGRILEETMPLLRAAGVDLLEDPEASRKLIFPTSNPNVRVLILRATFTYLVAMRRRRLGSGASFTPAVISLH